MMTSSESLLSRFAVKNVKSLSSAAAPDGAPFEASLYFDGKRLAHVSYAGWGGPFDYDFSASGGRRHQASKTGDGAIEAAREYWRLTTDPKHGIDLSGPGTEGDLDVVVGELVNKHEDAKWLKRHCRTKVVVKLPGDGPNQWSTFKGKYAPEFAAELRKEYGEEIYIANEHASTPPSSRKGG